MKRLLIALLALPLLALGLAILAPATWVDHRLQRLSHGALGLAGAEGRLWRGAGTLQAILPSGDVATLAPVRWSIDPWTLATGRLRLDMLSARDGKPLLAATVSPAGVAIGELRLDVPAALLGSLSPTLREAGLSGRISLRASGVRIDRDAVSGSGELIWREAGSTLTPVYPLGNYTITLTGAGRGVDFRIAGHGALALQGTGKWRPDAPLGLDATATPAPGQAQQLVPLLRMIGKQTASGAYQLELDANTGLAGRQ